MPKENEDLLFILLQNRNKHCRYIIYAITFKCCPFSWYPQQLTMSALVNDQHSKRECWRMIGMPLSPRWTWRVFLIWRICLDGVKWDTLVRRCPFQRNAATKLGRVLGVQAECGEAGESHLVCSRSCSPVCVSHTQVLRGWQGVKGSLAESLQHHLRRGRQVVPGPSSGPGDKGPAWVQLAHTEGGCLRRGALHLLHTDQTAAQNLPGLSHRPR